MMRRRVREMQMGEMMMGLRVTEQRGEGFERVVRIAKGLSHQTRRRYRHGVR
jgi:hypothetical protein